VSRAVTIGLAATIFLVAAPGVSLALQALDVACSPSMPVVAPSETIRVRAWAASDAGPLTYRWVATTGRIAAVGSDVDWTIDVSDARPPYSATVRVDSTAGESGTCTVEVWPALGARKPGGQEAGRALLLPGRHMPTGYGLYSYILLGSEPLNPMRRERYLKTLEAWRALVPVLAELERYLKPAELNVTLVPVQRPGDGNVSADWLLEHYDYARARVLLRAVGQTGRDGPYIVSSLEALGETAPLVGPHLFQDLSSVPPPLVAAWTSEFLSQSSQQRFWEPRTGARLALRMRTTLRVLANGMGDVQTSLGQWISWSAKVSTEPAGR
jgi:hypothetical protein